MFKGIHEVWMPRTLQTKIVSGMRKARRKKPRYFTVRLTVSVYPLPYVNGYTQIRDREDTECPCPGTNEVNITFGVFHDA